MEIKNRNAGLDYLRVAAILFVMIFHYDVYYGVPDWLEPFARFGWTGVDLFFVLSGYLISRMLLVEYQNTSTINFSRFYVNRSLRILPVFFFVVGLYFLFPVITEGRGLQPIWRFLTFTQNLPIDLRNNSFSHAWSLSVEEHFYLFFPLILLVIGYFKPGSKVIWIFLAVILIGAIFRYVSWVWLVDAFSGRARVGAGLKWVYYPSYNRLDGLLFGVAVAILTLKKPGITEALVKFKWIVGISGFALLYAAWSMIDGKIINPAAFDLIPSLLVYPLVSLGYACLVIIAANTESSRTALPANLMTRLAIWSYSIYLIHKIIYHSVNTQLHKIIETPPEARFILSMILAICAGAILYTLVEKPFLLLRSKINDRWFSARSKTVSQVQA